MYRIAENKSIEIFKSFVSETSNRYLKEITKALNITVDPTQPYLTPLYYCFPHLDLAKLFHRFGADPQKLSFLHCFFSYQKLQSPVFLDYLTFLVT